MTIGIHPSALANARVHGSDTARRMTNQQLRDADSTELCAAWGFDPQSVYGREWLASFRAMRNDILNALEEDEA